MILFLLATLEILSQSIDVRTGDNLVTRDHPSGCRESRHERTGVAFWQREFAGSKWGD